MEEWQRYRATLHGHHEAEDTRMFPALRRHRPELDSVIEQLLAEHRRLEPLLEQADQAFARLPETGPALAALAALDALLDPHFELEEREIVPLLRPFGGLPPVGTEEELVLFVEHFAWSCEGVAPDVLSQIDASLPDVLRARMPAARANIAARSQRVWGAVSPATSRTSIPGH